MTRLITFGCSNTFGLGLRDVWNYEKNYSINHQGPSKYAWPQLLADKLNLECVNLGILGASNKEIWYSIVNAEFKNDDMVIILWTWYDRYCILNEKKLERIQIHWHEKTPQATCFFKHLHNEYDMLIDFYLRCNHIQLFLENKVKLIKHLRQETSKWASANQWLGSERKEYNPEHEIIPNWNKINFLNVSMSNIRHNYPPALDNSHPGPEAYEAFAIAIYNKIKNDLC